MKFVVTNITTELVQNVKLWETSRGSHHEPIGQEFEAQITLRGLDFKSFLECISDVAGDPVYVELTNDPQE